MIFLAFKISNTTVQFNFCILNLNIKIKSTWYRLCFIHGNKIFIGQTSRLLGKCYTLYKSDGTLHLGKALLAEHIHNLNHKTDFDSVTILAKNFSNQNKFFRNSITLWKSKLQINKNIKIDLHLLHGEIYSYSLSVDLKSEL